jgi:hypothetical protein
MELMSPLTGMCSNNREFVWTKFHDECFRKLKEKIWVITDTSATGIGAWYGQGPTWDMCWPAGFISRKFTPAQMNLLNHVTSQLTGGVYY